MKVLFITNLCLGYSATLPERSLLRGLHVKGVDLTIMTPWQTPESFELESSGIRIVYFPVINKIDFKAIREIRSLVKREHFDIIHLTYSKAITNGLIASIGLNVKIVAYLGSLSLYWHDPFSYLSFLNKRINKLICLSDGVAEHVLKQAPVRMKGKTIRIYKGYDPQWLEYVKPAERKDLRIPGDAFVIGCVANLRKIKGVDYLIKAADYLPENLPVWFLLVGKDSDSKTVHKLIGKTRYPHNFLTIGYSKDPLSYTSICNLYVQPSLSEGLGRSVIEAMCLRKPVIVTDKGGAKELVEDGINGYVVPIKSAQSIAEKIIKCLENRDANSEMGEKAREKIVNDFRPQTMIDQTYDLYVDLLKVGTD
jgi:L-malate glycosyltransferase